MATPVPIRSSSITKQLLIYYAAILVGFAELAKGTELTVCIPSIP